jgi:3-hydroxyacyl-[acyl-carrier-protein] dehydratase
MAQPTDSAVTVGRSWPTPPVCVTPPEAAVLRDVARRCSPATYDAACRFRRTGDVALLPVLIPGLIERYVEPGLRARLKDPPHELRLSEDLGIDSLTLLEFAMFAEDVLGMAINNDELDHLRTLGDMQRFAEARLVGLSVSPAAQVLLADSS